MFREILNSTRSRENSIKFLIATILIKLNLCKLIIIDKGDYKIRFYPSESSRELWINLNYPTPAPYFCKKYLIKGDIVIDVGSNIGLVTLQAAMCVGNIGKVYSIEPHPKIFQFLSGNLNLNKVRNVELFNLALGDKSGMVYFSNQRSDVQNRIVYEKSNDTIEVPLRLLDELSINESKIDLLKIDVEGFEAFVLRGGKNILRKTICVYIETIEKLYNYHNYDFKEIFQILTDSGFELFSIYDFSLKKIHDGDSLESSDIVGLREKDDFVNRTKFTLQF